MLLSPAGLKPEQDWAGKDQQKKYINRPVLSSERALQNNKPATA
jgi:hypothetical protein